MYYSIFVCADIARKFFKFRSQKILHNGPIFDQQIFAELALIHVKPVTLRQGLRISLHSRNVLKPLEIVGDEDQRNVKTQLICNVKDVFIMYE